MAGLKIKEAELINELTEDCLFPISDGSGNPRVANFMKVKILLGDAKSVENKVNSLQREVNYLTRSGQDSGLSVKDIAERAINPTSTNVVTLIGNDFNKSVRTIANEVLAGASTGGGIDLDLYLSKSEAEATYEKKGVGYTKGEADTKINEAVRINGEELFKKADKETVDDLSASIGANIDAIDTRLDKAESEVSGVKGDLSEANDAIEAIEAILKDTANKSDVEGLAESINTNKSIIDIIIPQVATNTEAIKDKADKSSVDALSERVDQAEDDIEALQTEQGTQKGAIQQQAQNIANLYADLGTKASQEAVDAISESVKTLEGSVDEISNRVNDKADKEQVQTLASQINTKADSSTVTQLSNKVNGISNTITNIQDDMATQGDINGLTSMIDAIDTKSRIAFVTPSK